MKPSSDPKHRRALPSILLSGALLAALACISADTSARAQAPEPGIRVTVMLYSGRPNPSFEITDPAVIDRLRTAYAEASPLEGFERDTVVPSILGYQGVRIENPGGESGLPRVILAYRSNVEVRNGGVRFLSDSGRRIENTVIEEAAERDLLDDQALRMIRQDSEPRYPGRR